MDVDGSGAIDKNEFITYLNNELPENEQEFDENVQACGCALSFGRLRVSCVIV